MDAPKDPERPMNFSSSETPEGVDLLWKQFVVQVDLYKFFFDMTVKIDIFYYTITGAILGFYLNKGGQIRYALPVPIILGLAPLVFFHHGKKGIEKAKLEVDDIQKRLPLKMRLDIKYLPAFLMGHMAMFLASAIALLILLIFPGLVRRTTCADRHCASCDCVASHGASRSCSSGSRERPHHLCMEGQSPPGVLL